MGMFLVVAGVELAKHAADARLYWSEWANHLLQPRAINGECLTTNG